MAKIIAICNQKGGTGKTTTAVNLSVAVGWAGKKVLLLDIDPQANATSGAGIDKHKLEHSVYDVLINETPVGEVLTPSPENKITVLPSNSALAGAEVELVAVLSREYRLKRAIEGIKAEYDFIFVDCPPSLGLLTINALAAADSVLIPVQCEYYALEGLTQLLNTVSLVQKNLNADLEIEGVLLTMADYRTNLTQDVISEVRSHFKEKVYNAIIPRNVRLTEAPSFGKSIFLYDKDSPGAKKYTELANEMLEVNNAQPLVNNRVKDIITETEVPPAISPEIIPEALLNEGPEKEGIA